MVNQNHRCPICGSFFNSFNSLYVHGRRSHDDVRISSISEKKMETKLNTKKRKNRNKYRAKMKRSMSLKSDKIFQCSYILSSGQRCQRKNVGAQRCKIHETITMKTKQTFLEYSENLKHSFLSDPCLKHIENLRLIIKKSSLPDIWNETTSTMISAGNGLFAYKSFQKNDFITQYAGQKLNTRPEDMSYVYGCPTTWKYKMIDGLRKPVVGQGVGSFANRASEKHKAFVNARFYPCNVTQTVWLKATKLIHAGDEIFIRYGTGHTLI